MLAKVGEHRPHRGPSRRKVSQSPMNPWSLSSVARYSPRFPYLSCCCSDARWTARRGHCRREALDSTEEGTEEDSRENLGLSPVQGREREREGVSRGKLARTSMKLTVAPHFSVRRVSRKSSLSCPMRSLICPGAGCPPGRLPAAASIGLLLLPPMRPPELLLLLLLP